MCIRDRVTNGRDALSAFVESPPDLVVLDLGLPDVDGVEVLRRMRRISRVPVVVLSARQDSDDKVEALDEGADDYVTKPFGMDELMARIRAAIRRGGEALASTPPFSCDDFTLGFDERTCEASGAIVHLTPTEWRLLAELARHDGRIVPVSYTHLDVYKRQPLGLPLVVQLYLVHTIVASLIGGMAPAIVTAVISSLTVNWFFTPPIGNLTIAAPENALALALFIVVAAAVSLVCLLYTSRCV